MITLSSPSPFRHRRLGGNKMDIRPSAFLPSSSRLLLSVATVAFELCRFAVVIAPHPAFSSPYVRTTHPLPFVCYHPKHTVYVLGFNTQFLPSLSI